MNTSQVRNVIIVGSTLVVILAMMVTSVNTLEIASELQTIKVLPTDYNPYQKLYDEMLYPTVRIETINGVGSGVIIKLDADKRRLTQIYILTASHVVGNNSSVTVTFYSYLNNKQDILCELRASVVMTDTGKDLALLRTQISADLKDNIHKAKLAPENYKPFIFTEVWTVGCSLGLNPRPSFGHLCGLGDSVVNYWEVSSPILPGNSGGPVFTTDMHEVIGIAVWVKVYHGQLITTMAGIVPINQIYEFLDKANLSVGCISLPDVSPRKACAWGRVNRLIDSKYMTLNLTGFRARKRGEEKC